MALAEEVRNALPKGYEIEGYRIDRVLGAGGFGVTYLATEISINRRVAIKEYLPSGIAVRGRDDVSVHPVTSGDKSDFDWGLERFKKEAETLVTFRHPNIISVFRFFQANGTAYLVMAYEDGESLATILERAGRLSEAELREILEPLLSGLEHVHKAGFLHRDIKPGNIYVRRDGSPVLLDFGAARLAMGGRSQSLTSIVSAGYAPFEQYTTRGNQGAWSDIYALGGVLYRAATGHRPPDAPDRVRKDPYVAAVEAGRGQYSHHFLAAIDASLRMNEEERPQSVAQWRPMFDGGAPAVAVVGEDATLAAGMADAQTLVPSSGRAKEEGRTRWPSDFQSPKPSGRSTQQAQPPATTRRGSAKWVIIAVVAVLAVAGLGAGGFYFVEERKEAEAVRRSEAAASALREARDAAVRGDFSEAQRKIDEAKRFVPDHPEIGSTEAAVRAEERKRTAQNAGEQVRRLLAQARTAIQGRDFEAAERALAQATEIAGQHQLSALGAEIQRVRTELDTARRSVTRADPVIASWPADSDLRRAVDETIRKIAPDGY
jgi:serine/threonine protein kinase